MPPPLYLQTRSRVSYYGTSLAAGRAAVPYSSPPYLRFFRWKWLILSLITLMLEPTILPHHLNSVHPIPMPLYYLPHAISQIYLRSMHALNR